MQDDNDSEKNIQKDEELENESLDSLFEVQNSTEGPQTLSEIDVEEASQPDSEPEHQPTISRVIIDGPGVPKQPARAIGYDWVAAFVAYCIGAPLPEIAETYQIPIAILKENVRRQCWQARKDELPLPGNQTGPEFITKTDSAQLIQAMRAKLTGEPGERLPGRTSLETPRPEPKRRPGIYVIGDGPEPGGSLPAHTRDALKNHNPIEVIVTKESPAMQNAITLAGAKELESKTELASKRLERILENREKNLETYHELLDVVKDRVSRLKSGELKMEKLFFSPKTMQTVREEQDLGPGDLLALANWITAVQQIGYRALGDMPAGPGSQDALPGHAAAGLPSLTIVLPAAIAAPRQADVTLL